MGQLLKLEPLVLLKDSDKNNLAIIIDSITKKTIAVAILQQIAVDNTNKGNIYWLTGLSGSGKTTIAKEIIKLLSLDMDIKDMHALLEKIPHIKKRKEKRTLYYTLGSEKTNPTLF